MYLLFQYSQFQIKVVLNKEMLNILAKIGVTHELESTPTLT